MASMLQFPEWIPSRPLPVMLDSRMRAVPVPRNRSALKVMLANSVRSTINSPKTSKERPKTTRWTTLSASLSDEPPDTSPDNATKHCRMSAKLRSTSDPGCARMPCHRF